MYAKEEQITHIQRPRSGLIYVPNPHPGNYDLCHKGNTPSRCGSTHLSLSSAAFSASSSFCRAVAKRSWARSSSSSTSWMRLFREATSLSAWAQEKEKLIHNKAHIFPCTRLPHYLLVPLNSTLSFLTSSTKKSIHRDGHDWIVKLLLNRGKKWLMLAFNEAHQGLYNLY